MLALSGCVADRARFKPYQPATAAEPSKQAELYFWRVAFLYPFKVVGLELDAAGRLKMSQYETDGGAAGFCTVLDASGKFMGTMSAAAAKAALAK
jgi:hypothetical protein